MANILRTQETKRNLNNIYWDLILNLLLLCYTIRMLYIHYGVN